MGPHVAAHRRFSDDTFGPRATAHDTAVAAVVSETASSSDLYLASVGRTPTAAEYADAVSWLVERDVSVVVDSGSYFPTVGGRSARITNAAERAVETGVVFVTSAGNYARRHWSGQGVSDGWVAFDDGVEANAIANGSPTRGRVSLRLRWASGADYDLYLYRRGRFGGDSVVAASTARETGPGRTVEAIDVAVPRGRYYVAVHAHRGVDAPRPVQLFAAYHSLEYTTARGSMVAPATSDRTIAVGAAGEEGPRPYSSRDATGHVDVTAPSRAWTDAAPALAGTSAAAPYVAGTAALMQSRNRNLSPSEVETILERTAGNDTDIDALAAVDAASTVGTRATPDRTPPADRTLSTDDVRTYGGAGSTAVDGTASPTSAESAAGVNETRPEGRDDERRASGRRDTRDERDSEKRPADDEQRQPDDDRRQPDNKRQPDDDRRN
ncbi:S8 family serine peptidase [Haloplanus sp. GCM10025708]|uniref:S8 family serine peptidase n=1 Tax=Haloplanus sp. GCM10025708 TaxID=3252679 RepID=UPI003615FEA9